MSGSSQLSLQAAFPSLLKGSALLSGGSLLTVSGIVLIPVFPLRNLLMSPRKLQGSPDQQTLFCFPLPHKENILLRTLPDVWCWSDPRQKGALHSLNAFSIFSPALASVSNTTKRLSAFSAAFPSKAAALSTSAESPLIHSPTPRCFHTYHLFSHVSSSLLHFVSIILMP